MKHHGLPNPNNFCVSEQICCSQKEQICFFHIAHLMIRKNLDHTDSILNMLSNLLLNGEERKYKPIYLHLLKMQLTFFCNTLPK